MNPFGNIIDQRTYHMSQEKFLEQLDRGSDKYVYTMEIVLQNPTCCKVRMKPISHLCIYSYLFKPIISMEITNSTNSITTVAECSLSRRGAFMIGAYSFFALLISLIAFVVYRPITISTVFTVLGLVLGEIVMVFAFPFITKKIIRGIMPEEETNDCL